MKTVSNILEKIDNLSRQTNQLREMILNEETKKSFSYANMPAYGMWKYRTTEWISQLRKDFNERFSRRK